MHLAIARGCFRENNELLFPSDGSVQRPDARALLHGSILPKTEFPQSLTLNSA